MARQARATRTGTARNLQSRSAEQRESAQDHANDILWFPKEWQPPGFEYGWIRMSCLNQQDGTNMRQRQIQGWKPIPSSRHPEMMGGAGWEMVMGNDTGYIERGGLIWCECPTALLNKRRRAMEEETQSALRMPHIEMDKGAKAPTFDDSKLGFERIVTERREGDAEFKD